MLWALLVLRLPTLLLVLRLPTLLLILRLPTLPLVLRLPTLLLVLRLPTLLLGLLLRALLLVPRLRTLLLGLLLKILLLHLLVRILLLARLLRSLLMSCPLALLLGSRLLTLRLRGLRLARLVRTLLLERVACPRHPRLLRNAGGTSPGGKSGPDAVRFPSGEVEDRRKLVDGRDERDVDLIEQTGERLDGLPGPCFFRVIRRLDSFNRQIEPLFGLAKVLLEPSDDHRARRADVRRCRFRSGRGCSR